MTIILDTTTYDVPIIALDETCDFLDKYAERTDDGVLHREIIGCYFNQQIQFGSPVNSTQKAAMDALWERLTDPDYEFHEATVPSTDGTPFVFNMYVSNVKRSLRKWTDTKTYWKGMTANFIAQSPARTPT